MKKLTILVVLLVAVFNTSVYAQEDGNRDANGKVVRGPYLTNNFWDNWFIDAGVGAGMYLGGHNRNFGQRITPSFGVSFGKWFTPSVGARVYFNYMNNAKEFIGTTQYKFNYWTLHADLMWNLSNAFGGYKETRVYQAIPYLGAGYSQIVGSSYFPGVGHGFSVHAGLINKFRVSNRIDLNLQLSGDFLVHYQDRIQASRTIVDVPVSALVSVTFKLGKTNFQRASKSVAADKVAAAVENTLKEQKAEVITKEVIKEVPVTVPAETPSGDISALYFNINTNTLSDREQWKIKVASKYLQDVVKSGKKIVLIGSADNGTGNANINMKLSEQRITTVKNILVKQYNIPADMIIERPEGDTNNKFNHPVQDRCVVIEIK